MAHPSSQTNGASLEDCHTNFFALTDLCGIRWRRLTSEGPTPNVSSSYHPQHGMGGRTGVTQAMEYLNDPILLSYSRCLSHDILCVWRRIPVPSVSSPNSANFPPFGNHGPFQNSLNSSYHSGQGLTSLNGAKELWIFWYGDEPELSRIVAPELMSVESEQGSWENGLSYECRSLLFKALHNLIERCLLSREFVRLGKWFVQPEEGADEFSSSTSSRTGNLSFSFSFFVHGESTVCASVDVRRHPAVRKITPKHVAAARASTSGLRVLLAPYGLTGMLTGQCYRTTDHATRKLAEEWRQFYPMVNASYCPLPRERGPGPGCGSDATAEQGNIDLPAMVEVIVGGMRMKYPICFAFICETDFVSNQAVLNQLSTTEGGGFPPTPPHSPCNDTKPLSYTPGSCTSPPAAAGSVPAVAASRCATLPASCSDLTAGFFAEQAWQDSTTSCDLPREGEGNKENHGAECELEDPAIKSNCFCSRRSKNNVLCNSSQPSGEWQKHKGVLATSTMTWKGRSGGGTPFHLRRSSSPPDSSPTSKEVDQQDIRHGQDRFNRPASDNCCSVSSASAHSVPLPSYPRFQASQRGENLQLVGTVDNPTQSTSGSQLSTAFQTSPASLEPSPQRTPHSQQPVSIPSTEPGITAPSPHRPPSDDASTFVPSTPLIGEPHHHDIVSSKVTPSSVQTPGGPKSEQAYSPYVSLSSADTPGWPHSVGPLPGPRVAQRPNVVSGTTATPLPAAVPNTEAVEQDYGIRRPVLPIKDYEKEFESEERSPELLYDYSSLNAWLYHPVKKFKATDGSSVPKSVLPTSLPNKEPTDSECASATQTTSTRTETAVKETENTASTEVLDSVEDANKESRKRKEPGEIQEDDALNSNATAKTPVVSSLFTSQGLEPSIRDLENIFDNSDETNDETFAVPTPPGSNKPASTPEDAALSAKTTSRVPPAHPSPGNNNSFTYFAGGPGGVHVLASSELSKMFPTPPSLEHPIQSPCGPAEILTDVTDTQLSNLVKLELAFNGASPSSLPEENDCSYVYRPPVAARPVLSAKYAPLLELPSQTLPPITLPPKCEYRSSFVPSHNHHQPVLPQRQLTLQPAPVMRPYGRLPMPPPSHFPRGLGPTPFSPISPSPYIDGGPPFAHSVGHPRLPMQGTYAAQMSPSSNTLKQLLQHQQHQQQHQVPQQPALPECHSLTVNIILGESLLNIFRDHNFDSCAVCVCSAGPNCIGTIKGPDAIVYFPDSAKSGPSNNRLVFGSGLNAMSSMSHHMGLGGSNFLGLGSGEEETVRCNCGFSAIVNRKLSHRAGLFYEDEVEITGSSLTEDPAVHKKKSLFLVCQGGNGEKLELKRRVLDLGLKSSADNKQQKRSEKDEQIDTISSTTAAVAGNAALVDSISPTLMELLREQCLLIQHSSSPIYKAATHHISDRRNIFLNTLEFSDCTEIVRNALSLSVVSVPPPNALPLQYHPPMHSPYQHQQHWSQPPPHQGQPYMPFGNSPVHPHTGMGFTPGLHPMSPASLPPSLPSPGNMPLRGRPPNLNCAPTLPRTMTHIPTNTNNNSNGPLVHYWSFLHADGPTNSQDIIRVMRTLQPLLQEAIQKKRSAPLWGAPFTVEGPLTWRQFHRMAVRGTEDHCEPQPIPAILAGYDRDWVSVGPLAIPHWERLLLEPYSQPKDVTYIVIAPEVDSVLSRVKHYFKELSSVYEMCRLGRHVPLVRFKRSDGILRVGRSAANKLAGEPVDEWFTCIGDSQVAAVLRLYAKVCRHQLAPLLASTPIDRTLMDPSPSQRSAKSEPPPMAPPTTAPFTPAEGMAEIGPTVLPPGAQLQPSAGVDAKPLSPKAESSAEGGESGRSETGSVGAEHSTDEEGADAPSIVIYMVDPFSSSSETSDVRRLPVLGLLRCYEQIVSVLPESVQSNTSLHLISLEAIMQLGTNATSSQDLLRSLALTVFSQCKKLPTQGTNVKSLTGFGPSAAGDGFCKSKDDKTKIPFRLYNPAFVLASSRDRTLSDLDTSGPATNTTHPSGALSSALQSNMPKGEKFSVLYVSYCLSEDQRWLLASCTDERGELIDNCTIGIDVPNRTKRKRFSVRRYGLQRLMDFIVGVISTSVHPWRLVIGRLGRMGHGELKSWSALLSRKSLLRVSRHMADICHQCSILGPTDVPAIVSACLVSLEPDSHFRMMPDQITPDERFGQQLANCSLSTPQDASCTHILVFPTSATTTSSQTAFHEQHINGPDLGDDDFLLSGLNDDMGDGFEGMGDLQDIFMWPEADSVNDVDTDLTAELTGGGLCSLGGLGSSLSPGASQGLPSPSRRMGIRGSLPESPSGMGCGRQSPGRLTETQEEVGTLLQQPLALAYYVSTAPIGDMPAWFWASCPHMAKVCPSFLKCALHLHNHAAQQGSDDLLQLQQQQPNSARVHPLDSQVTTDVLRFVMEGYNALSWLALDPRTKDRRSCLPVHIQLLVQLYHTMAALV